MAGGISEIDLFMAKGFSGGVLFPQNVRCPNRCKFCYEATVVKMFPRIKVKHLSVFNNEQFRDYVEKAVDYFPRHKSEMDQIPSCPIVKRGDDFYYFKKCDFFSLGLSVPQIEMILKYGTPMVAQTTGLNVDPDLVAYLTRKYPEKFSLSLSIITLDPGFRSKIMNPRIDLDKLKKICRIIKNSIYFLLYFHEKQLISDIGFLNEYSLKNKNKFSLCKLYYSKIAPEVLRKFAESSKDGLRPAIEYLNKNQKRLKDISSRITFRPDPLMFAWHKREEIKSLLKGCVDAKTSLVFCTPGAFPVIRDFLKESQVITVAGCFGGNVDFVLGMTVKEIVFKIGGLLDQGIPVTRVYLPDAMFPIERHYDFNFETIEAVAKAFPQIKVILIHIPYKLLEFALTLDDVNAYYKEQSRAGNSKK